MLEMLQNYECLWRAREPSNMAVMTKMSLDRKAYCIRHEIHADMDAGTYAVGCAEFCLQMKRDGEFPPLDVIGMP